MAVFFAFSLIAFAVSCSDMEKDYEGDALVAYPDITITGFTPASGTSGVPVTITGTNFGELIDAAEIRINNVLVTDILSYSDNQIVVRVPQNAGTGPVSVKVWTHTKATATNFEYLTGAQVTSISPSTGSAGDRVIISGTSFGTDESAVSVSFVNGGEAQILAFSDTEIEVVVPDGGTVGPVSVTVGEQIVTGPVFTYIAPPAGKYMFEFDNPESPKWLPVQNSTYVVEDSKMKVTFNPAQFQGTTKRRADLQFIINGMLNGVAKDPWVYTSEFPILAIKFTKPATGNVSLDATGAVFTNNTYNATYANREVYYYDLSVRITAPTASIPTFQFKIADITSPETGYEVDWIGTFRNTAELEAYIND